MTLLLLLQLALAEPMPQVQGPYFPGDTIEVQHKSYLLSESHLNRCLEAAAQADTCTTMLNTCKIAATTALTNAQAALDHAAVLEQSAGEQLESEARIQELLLLGTKEQAERIRHLKTQHNTAFVVASGTAISGLLTFLLLK